MDVMEHWVEVVSRGSSLGTLFPSNGENACGRVCLITS